MSVHTQNNMCILPQLLDIVIIPFFRRKEMDNQVAKIDQHPTGLGFTFNVIGYRAGFVFGIMGDIVG